MALSQLQVAPWPTGSENCWGALSLLCARGVGKREGLTVWFWWKQFITASGGGKQDAVEALAGTLGTQVGGEQGLK